jgi:hypothetical protein
MKSVLHLSAEKGAGRYPVSVVDAVDTLISMMTKKEMFTISRFSEADISHPSKDLLQFIIKRFGLDAENVPLMNSCMFIANSDKLGPEGASAVIVRELWLRLYETHRLRRVK